MLAAGTTEPILGRVALDNPLTFTLPAGTYDLHLTVGQTTYILSAVTVKAGELIELRQVATP
ncbi:hypothetical protein FBQ95_18505 [Chloroflexi bacterium CFX3]|nr:hypothetical protein [Chloroflexi bacterium CFX3]